SDRTTLLDADDFGWAYDLAADAMGSDQDRLVELAASLVQYDRTDTTDLLASDHNHPVYVHLRSLFEPVRLDSEQAVRGRKRHHRRRDRAVLFTEAEATQLVRRLHDRLDAAIAGEP